MRPSWGDDELDALRELVRDFLATEAVPRQAEWERQHHVDREFWLRAGELGLLCASIPEEYGGAGGRLPHGAPICEGTFLGHPTPLGEPIPPGEDAPHIPAPRTQAQKAGGTPPL